MDLTNNQTKVRAALPADGTLTALEVGEATNLAYSTVTRLLRELAAVGAAVKDNDGWRYNDPDTGTEHDDRAASSTAGPDDRANGPGHHDSAEPDSAAADEPEEAEPGATEPDESHLTTGTDEPEPDDVGKDPAEPPTTTDPDEADLTGDLNEADAAADEEPYDEDDDADSTPVQDVEDVTDDHTRGADTEVPTDDSPAAADGIETEPDQDHDPAEADATGTDGPDETEPGATKPVDAPLVADLDEPEPSDVGTGAAEPCATGPDEADLTTDLNGADPAADERQQTDEGDDEGSTPPEDIDEVADDHARGAEPEGRTDLAAAAEADHGTDTPAARQPRLAKGRLRDLVLAALQTSTEPLGPTQLSKLLEGKSQGAISNACDRLTESGDVVLTSESPRRFQATPTTR